jgi:hypothetical protein
MKIIHWDWEEELRIRTLRHIYCSMNVWSLLQNTRSLNMFSLPIFRLACAPTMCYCQHKYIHPEMVTYWSIIHWRCLFYTSSWQMGLHLTGATSPHIILCTPKYWHITSYSHCLLTVVGCNALTNTFCLQCSRKHCQEYESLKLKHTATNTPECNMTIQQCWFTADGTQDWHGVPWNWRLSVWWEFLLFHIWHLIVQIHFILVPSWSIHFTGQIVTQKYLPICFLQTLLHFACASETSKVGICRNYETGAYIVKYDSHPVYIFCPNTDMQHMQGERVWWHNHLK